MWKPKIKGKAKIAAGPTLDGHGIPLTRKQNRFVSEYLVDLNASQAALRAGYSPRTAPQQGSRLLKNVHVQDAIAAKQAHQLAAVEVRVEDVLCDLQKIALTDVQTLATQSGMHARYSTSICMYISRQSNGGGGRATSSSRRRTPTRY